MRHQIFCRAAIIVLISVFSLTAQAQSAGLADRLNAHYTGKAVSIKIPLPQKSPMLVYPDKKEKFDNELYQLKLERAGIGLEPGMVAVIRNIELDGREVAVNLVGVGYDVPASPIAPELLDADILKQGGATIRLLPDQPLSNAKDPIATLNSWLADIVSTRSLVSDGDLPEDIRTAIAEHTVVRGMNHKAVFLVLGEPTRVLQELRAGYLEEAWLYEREDFSTLMILFTDGVVELIKEF